MQDVVMFHIISIIEKVEVVQWNITSCKLNRIILINYIIYNCKFYILVYI